MCLTQPETTADMNDDLPVDRRASSATGIAVKLDLLHEDVQDMKTVLKELTAAISRLAVVESNQGHISAAQERGFTALGNLEKRMATYEKENDARIKALEAQSITSKQTNVWVDRAVWGTVAAVGMYVAKKVGLIL